jgi:5-methylthioadenosine/S-adenosylhomocysteine deaminase
MDSNWNQPLKTLMNATIVPMEPGSNIIENGFLVIEGDLITDIGAGNPVNPVNPIDLSGKIIIPGLINAHTHLAMTLYRGLADDLPLYDWLQNHIWPAEAKHTNRENVAMGAKLGRCEQYVPELPPSPICISFRKLRPNALSKQG